MYCNIAAINLGSETFGFEIVSIFYYFLKKIEGFVFNYHTIKINKIVCHSS